MPSTRVSAVISASYFLEHVTLSELLALRQTVLPPSGLPSAEHEELRRSAVIGLPAALSGQMDPNRDEYKGELYAHRLGGSLASPD